MQRIHIAGASGFGREVADWIQDMPGYGKDFAIHDFLDLHEGEVQLGRHIFPIKREQEQTAFGNDDKVVMGIGDPVLRSKCAATLRSAGASFFTVMHPTATVGSDVRIGEGCILCPNVVVTNNVMLGAHVLLNCSSGVGHDAVIGDCCTLSGHAEVNGWASLGCCVFMGSHATVLPRVKVADYTIVGAGSVVVRGTKRGSTVFGVPAAQVFQRSV